MSNALDTLNEIMRYGLTDHGRKVTCWCAQMEIAIEEVKELEHSLATAERELAELRREVEAARAELREKNGYILTDGR